MGIFDKLSGVVQRLKSHQPQMAAVDREMLLQKIRQSDLFKDVPPANLEQMFAHMETVPMKKGSVVISEGDEGDYYYLLVGGTAEVTRRLDGSGTPEVVARLDEPKGFGEEALISNAKRNATITMTSDGAVMRLSKDGFNDWIKEPLLRWLSPMQAQEEVSKGAKWIDVRDEEAAKSHLHGALQIPLQDIRERAAELDKNVLYICYCENGRLSSTAAFLLRQMGFNIGVLRGGLQSLKRAGLG
ncbi:MAG: cyclic nucleotide-binding domain-containing protein [Lentisphaerae bacterium]|nr:cyclic nucleotide-binding domain-containing protein [Lentisphaerota bacterium]